jgi:hypothetical protein
MLKYNTSLATMTHQAFPRVTTKSFVPVANAHANIGRLLLPKIILLSVKVSKIQVVPLSLTLKKNWNTLQL